MIPARPSQQRTRLDVHEVDARTDIDIELMEIARINVHIAVAIVVSIVDRRASRIGRRIGVATAG